MTLSEKKLCHKCKSEYATKQFNWMHLCDACYEKHRKHMIDTAGRRAWFEDNALKFTIFGGIATIIATVFAIWAFFM